MRLSRASPQLDAWSALGMDGANYRCDPVTPPAPTVQIEPDEHTPL